MSQGAAVIHGTLMGFIVVGFSWMKLFFRPAQGTRSDDLEIMRPDQRKQAFRCDRCGGVFVDQQPWLPQ
jgi:hypothetical protein